MAEQYIPPSDAPPLQAVEDAANLQQSGGNTLIHVDFRPNPSREEVTQRIGEVITSWWLTEAGAGAISHEPMGVTEDSDGNLNMRFKQFKRGFDGDELGIPHLQGWSGLETINVLDIEWGADSHIISHNYVHPRNFRYILPQHEARKRLDRANNCVSAVNQGSRRRPIG